MTKALYLFEISRATEQEEIRSLVEDAAADDSLFGADKEEIGNAAGERMAQLNAQAVGAQKGRWL